MQGSGSANRNTCICANPDAFIPQPPQPEPGTRAPTVDDINPVLPYLPGPQEYVEKWPFTTGFRPFLSLLSGI